jgi:hypothetical protein
VAKKFAKLLGMDPWLINPMYRPVRRGQLPEGEGLECVRSNVDALLTKIRRKYKEYGINEKPFVVVKADNGTYGMGIMTVRDAKELDDSTAAPQQDAVVKDGQGHEVIIQEGVPTYERINDAVAEPVVYMIDRYVVGGFYRVHAERGIDENLNAPGSSFVPLAFAEPPPAAPGVKPGASAPNRFYMYGVIGRLAMLAASYELEATDPEAESTSEPCSPAWRTLCAVAGLLTHCTTQAHNHSLFRLRRPPQRVPCRIVSNAPHPTKLAALAALTLGALGVVYGDIGTSPLYALKEVFHGGHLATTPENILGILSLIFWTMTVIVSR